MQALLARQTSAGGTRLPAMAMPGGNQEIGAAEAEAEMARAHTWCEASEAELAEECQHAEKCARLLTELAAQTQEGWPSWGAVAGQPAPPAQVRQVTEFLAKSVAALTTYEDRVRQGNAGPGPPNSPQPPHLAGHGPPPPPNSAQPEHLAGGHRIPGSGVIPWQPYWMWGYL